MRSAAELPRWAEGEDWEGWQAMPNGVSVCRNFQNRARVVLSQVAVTFEYGVFSVVLPATKGPQKVLVALNALAEVTGGWQK